MRIAIDASSVPAQPAGAGVYAIELVRALAERDRHDGYALFTAGSWAGAMLDSRPNWRIERVGAASGVRRLAWEQVRLPRVLDALRIDVLHSTHHTLPLLNVGCKRVVTIHDVTFFRMPERYPPARRLYMQTMTRLATRVANAFIVPSRAVQDDVVRLLGVMPDRVTPVYEAAGEQYRPVDPVEADAVAKRYGIDAPFVLSVGSLEPGKNRRRVFRAMRRLRDEGLDYRLVVVGQKAWKYEGDFALVDALGMRDRIIFPGYVKQDDLPALYGAATAFVFPSLYEGFGLPVIEAMSCGTPVLTSNISATAEVAGDAALLVDPLSVEAIADGLRRLLRDAELRADLSKRGLLRAAEFRWHRAAAETHAVYAKVTDRKAARS
ncbi:MAG: glycosyltransferase family 4 protein [Chloroflexota bacterium]|nr:glycosyltransferase family 4 protein [Chloroflexota bacterium]